MKSFEQKFKEKSGLKLIDRLDEPKAGKYTFLERNYEQSSDDEGSEPMSRRGSKDSGATRASRKVADCSLHMAIQDLLKLIFNQDFFQAAMMDLNYDAKKLPLGKLSKTTLNRGYQALKDLGDLFNDSSLASKHGMDYEDAVQHLSNRFFTLIPHDSGRSRPPVISDQNRLKIEVELLDSLTDMSTANDIMKIKSEEDDSDIIHPLDRQFQGLGLETMEPVDPSTSEYTLLEDYLIKTHSQTHYMKFQLEGIFRVERKGENARFAASPFARPLNDGSSDRRLLWHGSRATNFGGILSQGLRIAPPEAPVSGYMFGKGKKSLSTSRLFIPFTSLLQY